MLKSRNVMEGLRVPLQIPDQAFDTLITPNTPLDDLVISGFLRLLERRSILLPADSRIWSFDTFFYIAFKQGGYARVANWTKGENLFEKDIVFFPIHVKEEYHWALIAAWPKRKVLHAMDSLGRSRIKIINELLEYFETLATKLDVPFNRDSWLKIGISAAERQPKGSLDCGVYVCWYATQLATNRPINGLRMDCIQVRKDIASALRKSKAVGKAELKGDDTDRNLFVGDALVRKIETASVPKFNPNYHLTGGVCYEKGTLTQYWTSWDPLLEALNEAINEEYQEVESPVIIKPIRVVPKTQPLPSQPTTQPAPPTEKPLPQSAPPNIQPPTKPLPSQPTTQPAPPKTQPPTPSSVGKLPSQPTIQHTEPEQMELDFEMIEAGDCGPLSPCLSLIVDQDELEELCGEAADTPMETSEVLEDITTEIPNLNNKPEPLAPLVPTMTQPLSTPSPSCSTAGPSTAPQPIPVLLAHLPRHHQSPQRAHQNPIYRRYRAKRKRFFLPDGSFVRIDVRDLPPELR